MSRSEWPGEDRCPHCRDAQLEQRRELGVRFQGCPRCDGVWIAVSHLTAYVEASTRNPGAATAFRRILDESIAQDEVDGSHLRFCPRCPSHLERFGFGERPFVVADRCLEHGLWLDDGDMERMVRQARVTSRIAEGGLPVDGSEPQRSEPSSETGGSLVCPNCGRRYPEDDEDQRCDHCNVVLYPG